MTELPRSRYPPDRGRVPLTRGADRSQGFVPVNPPLGSLADHGWPTFAHAVRPGSPAVVNGQNAPTRASSGTARFFRLHKPGTPAAGSQTGPADAEICLPGSFVHIVGVVFPTGVAPVAAPGPPAVTGEARSVSRDGVH